MVENYYGNKRNQIVHDLSNEKPKCEIKQIKIIHKRYFMPDTYEQAMSEGYTNCPHCIKMNKLIDSPIVDTSKELEESNKARDRIVDAVDIEQNQKEEKMRIKASRAVRRSGKSAKNEGKVSKSKAKTKESRSSKKIATVRKRRQ